MFQSWKSDLHVAALTTKNEAPTLCYLYGRMLLMLLTYSLCPQIRAQLWMKKTRELSLLKLMRHLQAFAASWMQAIFQSEVVLHRVLVRVCATAERLVVKASRKRRTTAQILPESLCQQHDPTFRMACLVVMNIEESHLAYGFPSSRSSGWGSSVSLSPKGHGPGVRSR
jgi:hypothetical protein